MLYHLHFLINKSGKIQLFNSQKLIVTTRSGSKIDSLRVSLALEGLRPHYKKGSRSSNSKTILKNYSHKPWYRISSVLMLTMEPSMQPINNLEPANTHSHMEPL